jgi:hypothetical protein
MQRIHGDGYDAWLKFLPQHTALGTPS